MGQIGIPELVIVARARNRFLSITSTNYDHELLCRFGNQCNRSNESANGRSSAKIAAMSNGTIEPIQIELPTPFAVGPVNAYLFTAPEPILVDCGVDNEDSWQALTDGLAAHGLTMADIQRVVITHPHTDHFGAAHKILTHSNAQVWIADIGAAWLTDPRQHFQNRLDFYGDHFLPQAGATAEMIEGATRYLAAVRDSTTPMDGSRITQFRVGDTIPLGACGWQVLHMPGHSRYQTCFYQPDTEQLISADMLMPITPTPIVEYPPDGKTRQPSLPVFLDSLSRLEQMPIGWVYPGHGKPFDNANGVIARQRARIHQRKEECFALVADGVETAVSLTNIMYQSYPAGLRTAGLWMLIGYLDLLLAEGRIVADLGNDGTIRYRVTP